MIVVKDPLGKKLSKNGATVNQSTKKPVTVKLGPVQTKIFLPLTI